MSFAFQHATLKPGGAVLGSTAEILYQGDVNCTTAVLLVSQMHPTAHPTLSMHPLIHLLPTWLVPQVVVAVELADLH